jgi:glutathione peroxidase
MCELQQKYADRGFKVLAFPCNQFGGQEPGSASDIKNFVASRCRSGITVMDKVDVNGMNASPLFTWLKAQQSRVPFNDVSWNFEKFLIDRNGKPVERYSTPQSPKSFEDRIVELLSPAKVVEKV